MSVIGISPSDIVGGLRVAKKAVSALKRQDGAQDQYQTTKQSHDDLHAAVKALSEACSSSGEPSSTKLQQSLKHLEEKQERDQKNIQKYEAALGETSSPQKREGIGRKLKWAFQDDKQLRESDTRSRPALDAALLQTLQ